MDMKDRIRIARLRAGYEEYGGRARVCRDSGVNQNTWWCWENGRYEPGAENLAVIAEVTGCDLMWLITGKRRKEKKE